MPLGFRGCWILALGTNEADDVYDNSNVGFRERVARMMSIVGSQPDLWVNSISLVQSGGYAEELMQRWNNELVAACPRYPSMRIFDWASVAQQSWFISDGIHYTSPGYVARTHLIAQALATAFPSGRPPNARCLP